MDAPADRTAKRISAQELSARFDTGDLLKQTQQQAFLVMRVPADRKALRTQ